MEIEIEVIKPKSENEKPIFSLSCPKLSRYKKIALEHEIEQIKKELVGFLIITGSI
jgi:predicted ATP-grasp superfamily ATP-dependent carboligase